MTNVDLEPEDVQQRRQHNVLPVQLLSQYKPVHLWAMIQGMLTDFFPDEVYTFLLKNAVIIMNTWFYQTYMFIIQVILGGKRYYLIMKKLMNL